MFPSGPSCFIVLIIAMGIGAGHSFSASAMLQGVSASICKLQHPPHRFQRCCPRSTSFGAYLSARMFSSENDSQQSDTAGLKLFVATAEDMEDVGGIIASVTLEDDKAAGSVIFLMGDLGAGKTAFARGFLRAATGDINLRVTSPTYLLANAYPANAGVGSNTNLECVSA